jgi:hypothetical protein
MYLPNKEPTAFELPACRQAGEPNELPTAPPRNMSLYKKRHLLRLAKIRFSFHSGKQKALFLFKYLANCF